MFETNFSEYQKYFGDCTQMLPRGYGPGVKTCARRGYWVVQRSKHDEILQFTINDFLL